MDKIALAYCIVLFIAVASIILRAIAKKKETRIKLEMIMCFSCVLLTQFPDEYVPFFLKIIYWISAFLNIAVIIKILNEE